MSFSRFGMCLDVFNPLPFLLTYIFSSNDKKLLLLLADLSNGTRQPEAIIIYTVLPGADPVHNAGHSELFTNDYLFNWKTDLDYSPTNWLNDGSIHFR